MILVLKPGAINDLTVRDKGEVEIRDTLKLRDTRPFMVQSQEYICPTKSIFKRIVPKSK